MEAMRIGMMLVGLGAVSAGVVGALLPAEQRLGAVLSLVAGAGVGLVVLAIGAPGSDEPPGPVFLVGSIAGFLTVSTVLGVVWRRSVRDHAGRREARSSARHSVR